MRSATLAFDFELPSSKLGAPPMTARASPTSLPDLGALRPDPAALPGRAGRPDWIAQATCIAAAVVLHIGALVAFILQPAVDEAEGAGGQYLEAIEISIVPSTVFESRETQPVEQAAAEKGEVTPEEGEQQPEEKPEEQPKPDEMQAAIEPEPQPKPPEEEPKPQSQGTTSAGLEAATPAPGAAAAGAGVMSRYAAEVRRALAKNKPDGRGHRGVATITFTITPAGKVKAARVTTSSDNEMLDKVALAAVERTAFPPPPAAMTERDLTYVIPFRFETKSR